MLERVRKYLDLSLAHIMSKDNDLLKSVSVCAASHHLVNKHAFVLVVYEYEYGYFIPITDIVADNPGSLKLMGFSEAFIRLIRLAKQQECKLLVLDRDAETLDELGKFEW